MVSTRKQWRHSIDFVKQETQVLYKEQQKMPNKYLNLSYLYWYQMISIPLTILVQKQWNNSINFRWIQTTKHNGMPR